MSIKTYVNGQENGAIAYKGDTEPCAVYVNGERQNNISYIPKEAEGVNSVSYKSEYKNNLRSLQIEGNTEQDGTLPSEYQFVEYIESTGTQYIDTGIVAGYNSRIYVKTTYDANNIVAVQNTTDAKKCIAITGTSNIEHFRFLQSVGTQFLNGANAFGVYEVELDNSRATAYYNGTTKTVNITDSENVSIGLTFFVFARNIDGVASGFSKRKLYALRLYNGDLIVRDYVPCYRKSDGIVGLYDLVNNTFYTNSGTGTFVKGADVASSTIPVITPTLASPQLISNCGNSQVDVTLETRGINLFDYNDPLLVADSSSNLRNYSPKFENGDIYNGGNSSARGAFICIKADRESAYSITFDADFDEETQTYRLYRIAEFDTFSNGVFSSPHYESDITIKKGENVAIAVSQGYQYIGISFRSSDKYGIKITNLRIEKTVLKNEGEKFDFSVIPLRSFKEIGISEVTSDSVVITSTEIVPTNNNGYCGSGGIKLGAICPQLEVGKTYVLDFDNDKQEYCNEIVYLTKSGEPSISWMKNNPLEITQTILDMTLVFFGYNIQKFSNALPLPVSVTISNMVAKEMPIPYQRTTVSIPANVVLESGANDVLLELAGLGEYKDTITIDRVNNKVKYTQRICRVRPFVNVGGTLSYAGAMPTHNVLQFALNNSVDLGATNLAKCEFAKVIVEDTEVTGLDANTIGIFFPNKDLVYIYFPISLGITSTEALDSYIMQTSNAWGAGIFYALEEPIEWSLPDYEASLMELARNTKNQTNIIEITSNPSVSKTSVNYAKWGGGESNV